MEQKTANPAEINKTDKNPIAFCGLYCGEGGRHKKGNEALKKKVIIAAVCLLILSGCSGQPYKEKDAKKTPETAAKEEAPLPLAVSEEKKLKSPIDALSEAKLINYDDPADIYPQATQLRFDYQSGSNKMKVFLSSDGLPDDEVKKEEYQIELEQQEDGNWEIAEKKLIREECWPGRSCK
jgi:hypothetical protein